MQKKATRVFMVASVAFSFLGTLMMLLGGPDKADYSIFSQMVQKLFFINIFIILSSFALSIAGKYLKDKS